MSDWSLEYDGESAILSLDCQESKVNTLNPENMQEFSDILTQIQANQAVTQLFICSAKPSMFIAGADIRLIQNMTTEHEALPVVEKGQSIFNQLEDLSATTVAIINGPCLGGGLELALSCDYRLVTDDPKVLIGLPEVKLGVLPGFGGTQRLPRLIGLKKHWMRWQQVSFTGLNKLYVWDWLISVFQQPF